MSLIISLFLFILLIYAPGIVRGDHSTLRNDTFNTMPDPNTSTFRSNSQIMWDHEEAQREGRLFTPFIYSGGTHATSVSLTSPAFATEAFTPERINQSSTAIIYSAAAADVCWTIISSDNNGIAGWTRTGSTAYYHKCQGTTTPVQPTLPPNSAWLMQVTISGTAITKVSSLVTPFPISPSNIDQLTSVRQYGAICDGVTDDTQALQRAMTQGKNITLPPGRTCLANLTTINSGVLIDGQDMARSLLLSDNSHLYIPPDTLLKLDGVRLSSIGKSNVKITGHGSIYCLNQVWTNDGYTGQGGAADGTRACVEFFKTSTISVTKFLLQGLEVYGDGPSVFGTIIIAADKKGKYGVHLSQVTDAVVEYCYIHNFTHEALSAIGTNADVWFLGNRVDNTNSDAINFNSIGMPRAGIVRNHVSGGGTIEISAGIAQDNVLTGGSNIATGGGGAGDIWIIGNQVEGGAIDISASTGGATNLMWVIHGNTVRNAPGVAIQARDLTGTVRLIDMQNNTVTGFALTSLGPAFSLILDAVGSSGVFNGNSAEGGPVAAGVTSCFSVGGLIGHNFCKTSATLRPYAVAYSSAQNRGQPALTPSWVLGSSITHTGTVVLTQLKAVTIPPNYISFSGCLLAIAQGTVTGVAGTKTIIVYYNSIPIAQVVEAAGDTNNWRLEGYLCDTGAGTAVSIGGIGINGTAIGSHAGGPNQPNTLSNSGTVEIRAQLANAGDSVIAYGLLVIPTLGLPMNP